MSFFNPGNTVGEEIAGPQGPKGDKGDTGAQGKAGSNGSNGKDGKDGLNGAKGATGAAGADGDDGLSAYQVWLNLGNTGTEQDFIDSLGGSKAIYDSQSRTVTQTITVK